VSLSVKEDKKPYYQNIPSSPVGNQNHANQENHSPDLLHELKTKNSSSTKKIPSQINFPTARLFSCTYNEMSTDTFPYNSLGFLMGKTMRIMGKHLKEHLAELDIELAKEHWVILLHLRAEDGQNQQILADQFYKDKGTIARAISHLEEAGLVTRKPDPDDGRQKRVFLTTYGQEISKEFIPLSQQVEAQAFRGLKKKEITAFKQVLKTIHENLK
jgi:DNA-binding MarR family transcriptional regulator